jgi:hypothetical protein
MAGSKSSYLEAALLDYVLSLVTYTPPGTVYVALSTAAFSTAATGTAMTEVTGGSYARIGQTNNATNWPASSGSNPSIKANGTAVTFATATANWGTVLSVYLVDAATVGNILYGADLAAGVVVNTGSGFSIPVGQFVLSET